MKKNRFFPRIVAGVLALGGAGGVMAKMEQGASIEQDQKQKEPEVIRVNESEQEKRLEDDPKFCAEHPIEAELRRAHVQADVLTSALDEAAGLIESHRYPDKKNEEKYFAACTESASWEKIQKSLHYAAEKTGVPERVLLAVGLIESQFQEDAERSDTSVHGPYQMTLETAREAARDAQEVFGFPIEVKGADDLHETKTAVRLAALRLRALQHRYGQLGLAIADYAGGRVGLEQKIKDHFPRVDFGDKEWKDMQRHHLAERQAQKQRDELLKRIKQGRASETDRRELRRVVSLFEAAGVAYKKAKETWKEKQDQLPDALTEAGVNIVSLYQEEKKSGETVPHSITYPLALDDMAKRAYQHVEQSAE